MSSHPYPHAPAEAQPLPSVRAPASLQILTDARAQREIDNALTEARRFKVPALGRDQISFMWSTDCVVDIECHLDYQPEEAQTLEYPGCSENVTLGAAYLRGVDILALLSDEQISSIEEKASIKHAENCKEAEGDRRIDQWLESRA